MCVQRTGQSDQFKTVKATDFKFDVHVSRDSPDMTPYKFFENGAWSESCDPQNFGALNANSSKTVKATDFKFDVHVSGDSADESLQILQKGGICKNSLGGDMRVRSSSFLRRFNTMFHLVSDDVCMLLCSRQHAL